MDIKNVSFSYNQKVIHLNNVSCQIQTGQVTTIIGPNGSGKSTLLGVMANTYHPHQGNIRIDGKELTRLKSKELAKKIAIVHQQNSAPADMTVERLVSYGRLPHKTMFTSNLEEDQSVVRWALTETNLLDKKDNTISSLSGGERQRVWIAMTLAQKTPYLFLDEPTTYLDIYYQYEILELVKRLNQEQGITIIMVLHDINQAIKYSNHIIVMKEGKIALNGKPKEVITSETIKNIYGIDITVREDKEIGFYTVPIGI